MSPTPGLLRRAAALGAAWLIFAPLVSAQVASILARHHEGQTILTWTEVPAVAAATDPTYSLEASPDLTARTAIQGRTYTAGPSPIAAQDVVAVGLAPRRFLRVRITSP